MRLYNQCFRFFRFFFIPILFSFLSFTSCYRESYPVTYNSNLSFKTCTRLSYKLIQKDIFVSVELNYNNTDSDKVYRWGQEKGIKINWLSRLRKYIQQEIHQKYIKNVLYIGWKDRNSALRQVEECWWQRVQKMKLEGTGVKIEQKATGTVWSAVVTWFCSRTDGHLLNKMCQCSKQFQRKDFHPPTSALFL